MTKEDECLCGSISSPDTTGTIDTIDTTDTAGPSGTAARRGLPRLRYPVVVEGRYDRAKLTSLFDAHIITTEGFGIFSAREKLALIRAAARRSGGILVLTDSDGAGLVIRNYFRSALPKELLHHVYIPQIPGRERRKAAPSKAGYLGVEGIDADLLRRLLAPYTVDGGAAPGSGTASGTGGPITKAEFYADGFSGRAGSAERRRLLCEQLDLPREMSANALLETLNLLLMREEYRRIVDAPPFAAAADDPGGHAG